MTATRIGRLATVVVLSAAWLVAAWLLWRTSVPSGLDVSGLRVQRFFSPHELGARRATTSASSTCCGCCTSLADVVVLAIFAWRAPRLARTIGLGRVGNRRDHRDARARDALVRLASVRLRGAVVAGAARARAARLRVVDRRAVGAALLRSAVRARGRRDRARPRRPLRRPLVAGRRADLPRPRRSASRSSSAISPQFGTHDAEPDAARRRAGARAARGRDSTRRCTSRTSATSRTRRTRTRAGSARRRTSSSGTRCSTAASRAERSASSLAHELGHVEASPRAEERSAGRRCSSFPILWLVTVVARRRGGHRQSGDASARAARARRCSACVAAPIENAVSRRYEAEADWAALQATHDPASARKLFRGLPADEPRAGEPADVGLPLAGEPPDDRAAHRDGRGVG